MADTATLDTSCHCTYEVDKASILNRISILEKQVETNTSDVAMLKTDIANMKDGYAELIASYHGSTVKNAVGRDAVINKEGTISADGMKIYFGGMSTEGLAVFYNGIPLLLRGYDYSQYEWDYYNNDVKSPTLSYIGVGAGVIYVANFTLQEDGENYSYSVTEYPIPQLSLEGSKLNIVASELTNGDGVSYG